MVYNYICWLYKFISSGDPLYAVGGQPKCFDYNVPEEIFAEDG